MQLHLDNSATEIDAIRKRSVIIKGKRTSISLEGLFWDSLKDIADREGQSLQNLVSEIEKRRNGSNLSSAVRVAILDYNIKMRGNPDYMLLERPVGKGRSVMQSILSAAGA